MSEPSNNGAAKKRWSSESSGSSHSEIDIDSYQRFHKSGFDLMSKALTKDEDSDVVDDRKTAVALYVRAISELEKGVAAIERLPKALKDTDEDRYGRAQGIKKKIILNLDLAKDRVSVLSEELESNLVVASKNQRNIAAFGTAKPRQSTAKIQVVRKFNDAAKNAPVAPSPRKPATTASRGTIKPVPSSSSSRDDPSAGRRPSQPASARVPRVPREKSSEKLPGSRPGSGPATPQSQRKNLGALKNVDNAMAQLILDQVIDNSPAVLWDDIAGQENAKQALQENVVWPALRPEIFKGLRSPARGILLFGPPGNGKTLLAKAVATESKQTFFNISASILTSKWVGEGEKLVRALFACAKELQPSIIFIDEIDSILSARKDSEHDAIRRLKTEFLVQFDGVGTSCDDRILVMGATNLPQELDLAALRRFPKRIMIPLPDEEARIGMIKKLVKDHQHSLTESDFDEVSDMTEGYSGSDLAALAKDAAMGPIRELDPVRVPTLKPKEIRPIKLDDFCEATKRIRPSVPASSLDELKAWSLKFADCS